MPAISSKIADDINGLLTEANSMLAEIKGEDRERHDIYFDIKEIEKLYIRDKHRHLIRLILKPAQIKVLDKVNEMLLARVPVRMTMLKSRRIGMSTLYCAMTYLLMRDFGYKATIVGQDLPAAKTLYKMIRLFNLKDSKWTEKPDTRNQRELSFSNGGEVWAATADRDNMARSQTNQIVLATEFAFWPDPANQMTALLDTVIDTENTFFFIETTANGMKTEFHDRWSEAELGEDEDGEPTMWQPHFTAWVDDREDNTTPFRNDKARLRLVETLDKEEKELQENSMVTLEMLNWRRRKIRSYPGADMDAKLDRFHQEHPTTPEEAFLGSGSPVLSQKVLAEWRRAAKAEEDGSGGIPHIYRGECNYLSSALWETIADGGKQAEETIEKGFIEDNHGNLKIWEWPVAYVDYEMGCDVAEGIETIDGSTDDSAIALRRRDNGNYVLRYRGKIDPELFAELIAAIGFVYNEAYTVVESNNHGLTTLKFLAKIYPDHRTYKSERGENIAYQEDTDRLGFQTNKKTKVLLLDNFARAVRNKQMQVFDLDVIGELSKARYNKRGGVDSGGLDDFMATALAEWAHISTVDYQKKPSEKSEYEQWQDMRAERKRIIDQQHAVYAKHGDQEEYEWEIA